MKSRMKGDERRAAILASAINLFAEKGFRGTTTRELAASLGVTEPVLYQHFQTKGELYAAIIETKARENPEQEAAFREHLERDDDRGLLMFLGELILERCEQDPNFIRLLLFSALERHELADLFYEGHMQPFYEAVAAYIRRRTEAGAFRLVEPNVAARGFIGMLSSYGQGMILFPQRALKKDRHEVITEMVNTFLNGLRVTQVNSNGGRP